MNLYQAKVLLEDVFDRLMGATPLYVERSSRSLELGPTTRK